MKKTIISLLAGLLMLGLANGANAATVQWASNGHYYDFVNEVPQNWDQAKVAAESSTYLGMQGHLATITSAAENLFISNNFTLKTSWLGGYQPAGADEPNGAWTWVTGESWDYTNWYPGEPNNYFGQDKLLVYSDSDSDGYLWDDVGNNYPTGYIVEYEATNAPVPEPSSMVLGLISAVAAMKARKKNKATV